MDVDDDHHQKEDENERKSPEKRILQPLAAEDSNLNMSEEKTAATPCKPVQAAAPGKKWAKVKKTEQTMDSKGYMVFQDVEVWEEVEDTRQAAKKAIAPKSVGVKNASLGAAAAG